MQNRSYLILNRKFNCVPNLPKVLGITFTAFLIAFSSSVNAQEPFKDEGFENWSQNRTIIEEPENWRFNIFSWLFGFRTKIEKVQDSYSGNHAVKVISDTTGGLFSTEGQLILSVGGDDILEGYNGIPFSTKVDSVNFFAKHEIAPNDTALVSAKFSKGGNVIDSSSLLLTSSQNSYQHYSIPIDWNPGDPKPDTLSMRVVSSTTDQALLNTVTIDSVHVNNSNAAIPNGNFERWKTYDVRQTANWQSLSLFTAYFSGNTLKRTTDSRSGNYAALLETKWGIFFIAQDTLGQMATGDMSFDLGGFGGSSSGVTVETEGVAIGKNPESIDFYYKYNPSGTDTGLFSYELRRWDDQKDTLITIDEKYVDLTAKSIYTKKSIEVDYGGTQTADTMVLNFASSKGPLFNRSANLGSQLYIDDLSVDYSKATSTEPENFTRDLRVYPNPVEEQITIQSEKTELANYELQTLTGKVARSGKLSGNGTHTIDAGDLSPGVYLLEVQGEDAVRTKKVVVK